MGRNGWLILAGVLLLLGVGSSFLEGIGWVTEETVIDAGPIEVSAEREERVALPMWLSGALVAGGIVALLVGVGRKSRA
jgi:hypothetical protein